MRKRLLLLLLVLLAPVAAFAHLGSKDVFETVHAGPYTLYVTIRPPLVIPGVATVEIRSTGASVTGIRITPLPVTGEASKHPPASDTMQRSATDSAFFTGSVWMMATGTWQVRIEADGAAGPQTASVPVLAVPVATLKMQRGMGFILSLLGLFLVVTMAGIVAASVRDARLEPGAAPTASSRRGGLIAMAVSVAVMVALVLLGGKWWNSEAANYGENVFQASPTTARLVGDQLDLLVHGTELGANGFPLPNSRSNKDYLPDHGHLIHLYAIRQPGMDSVFHLHPALVEPGDFRMLLPKMPAGSYKLYGDVVHASGFPETLLASVDIPETMQGVALDPEDAEALPAPLAAGDLGSSFALPDGYVMIWDKPMTMTAGTAYTFHFRLLDGQGQPATGMQPYLGMAGHAAFVKTDGTVFAHTHPEGSAAMADMMLADASMPGAKPMADMLVAQNVAPEIDFPYGFPTAGRYRIFIQMKHSGTVETGVFDAEVK